MNRLRCALLAAALVWPAGISAQADPLQAVEEMITTGRYTQARSALDRWQTDNPPGTGGASAEQRARALLLRARLASDGVEAQENYLSLVLSYPSSPHAPEALLRLGQALLVAGETGRATGYLQRLVTEHPANPHRAAGLLWLARAQGATGAWPTACQTVRDALATNPADSELAGLLRTEEETACLRPAENLGAAAEGPARPRPDAGGPPPARTQEEAAPRPVERTGEPANAAFSVQVAAVRSRENAESLARRLRARGFDARVVAVPANTLIRVRVGRHETRQEAVEATRALRQAGFEAIVVDDARTERAAGR